MIQSIYLVSVNLLYNYLLIQRLNLQEPALLGESELIKDALSSQLVKLKIKEEGFLGDTPLSFSPTPSPYVFYEKFSGSCSKSWLWLCIGRFQPKLWEYHEGVLIKGWQNAGTPSK